MMRRWCALAFLMVSGITSLAATPFDDAYRKDAEYLASVRAVDTATDALAKVQADPSVVPVSLTEAKDMLSEVTAKRALVEAKARGRVLSSWMGMRTAGLALSATESKAKLADLQLQSVQIRFQAGAASTQEVERTKDAKTKADAALAGARRNFIGAEIRLKVYGAYPKEEPGEPAALALETLTGATHPDLLAAQHQLAAAERALALAQGPDTAPLDRAARERELTGAKDTLQDTERLVRETLDAAKRRYQAARDGYGSATNAVKLAQVDLETARKRQTAGAISNIALLEAEIALQENQSAQGEALAELWQAYYGLLEAAGGVQ